MGDLRGDDLYDLLAPGEPRFDRDGSRVAYVVGGAERTGDSYRHDLYVIAVAGGSPSLVATGQGRLRRPAFSPVDDHIAFIDAASDGRSQLWIVGLHGGPPRQLTFGGEVSDFGWSPDGTSLAFCALEAGVDPRARRIREFTSIPIAADGLGVLDRNGPGLNVFHLRSGEVRAVAGGPYTYRAPAWSPDGRLIACARVPHLAIAINRGGELCLMSADGSGARVLASDVNWLPGPSLAFAPDSESIAYTTADLHLSGAPGRIARISVRDDSRTILTEAHDRSSGYGAVSDTRPATGSPGVVFSVDGRWVYYVAADRGSVPLFRCAADGSGTWEQVTLAGQCVADFAVSDDGTVAYTAQSDTEPDDLWLQPSTQPPWRVTRVSEAFWAKRPRVAMERFTVRIGDGDEAEAWILRPRVTGVEPLPAVLSIHGGPHGMFGYAINLDVQMWLDAGWAVVQVNPPGSTGYGFAYASAVWGDWGGRDVEYQLAALDDRIAEGQIDPARIAVIGTSYGGFVVNRLIARTNRFVCAVAENGTSDFLSVFGTSDFGVLYAHPHVGGYPWREPDRYLALSPLLGAPNVETPILILQSEDDHRQPAGQSQEWFTALVLEGKRAVLVRYPYDSHFMRFNGRPSNRAHRLDRIVSWFAEHLG